MEAYIKNKNLLKNKSRYGKSIPHKEIRVDLKKYFGRDDESFIKELKNDSDIEVNLVKPAGDSERAKIEKIETDVKKETEKKASVKKIIEED